MSWIRRNNRRGWRARLGHGSAKKLPGGGSGYSDPTGRRKDYDPTTTALQERAKVVDREYQDCEIDYEDLRYYPESPR